MVMITMIYDNQTLSLKSDPSGAITYGQGGTPIDPTVAQRIKFDMAAQLCAAINNMFAMLPENAQAPSSFFGNATAMIISVMGMSYSMLHPNASLP